MAEGLERFDEKSEPSSMIDSDPTITRVGFYDIKVKARGRKGKIATASFGGGTRVSITSSGHAFMDVGVLLEAQTDAEVSAEINDFDSPDDTDLSEALNGK